MRTRRGDPEVGPRGVAKMGLVLGEIAIAATRKMQEEGGVWNRDLGSRTQGRMEGRSNKSCRSGEIEKTETGFHFHFICRPQVTFHNNYL